MTSNTLILNITDTSDDWSKINTKPKNKIKKLKNSVKRDDFSNSKTLSKTNAKSTHKFGSRGKKKFGNNNSVWSLFHNNPEIPQMNLIEAKSHKEDIFSKHTYEELGLHPYLISCLKNRFTITETTIVQQKSIPILMNGSDCLIKSVTGSGKTLAYAIPIMQTLQSSEPKITRSDGIHAIVLVPTRELALQSFQCFSLLTKAFTRIVAGYLVGGEKKKSEKARIRKGINILIATPGRLLDHIFHTDNLQLRKIKWFIIDEADRLFEQGFEESASKIVQEITRQCEWKPQTVLLSATLSKGVERLAGISLVDPTIIDMSEQNMTIDSYAMPQNLTQHYMFVPAKLRLITLTSFIIDKCIKANAKALIFMSCQDVVDFHFTLFTNNLNQLLRHSNLDEISFFHLHGNMDQSDRVEVYHRFKQTSSGVLICTDVAARGLDLPEVDWIIQLSCAPKPEDYVHRVGRTARIGKNGNALQFILTSESKFLEILQNQLKINLNEINFKDCLKSLMLLDIERNNNNLEEHASKLQTIFEDILNRDNDLLNLAKKAYLSYIRSYASYPKSMSDVLPFKELHLGHIAKSFALQESPKALGAHGFRLKQQSIDLQQKYANNEPNKKRKHPEVPLEYQVSEFGGQLITKTPSNKKLKTKHYHH